MLSIVVVIVVVFSLFSEFLLNKKDGFSCCFRFFFGGPHTPKLTRSDTFSSFSFQTLKAPVSKVQGSDEKSHGPVYPTRATGRHQGGTKQLTRGKATNKAMFVDVYSKCQ